MYPLLCSLLYGSLCGLVHVERALPGDAVFGSMTLLCFRVALQEKTGLSAADLLLPANKAILVKVRLFGAIIQGSLGGTLAGGPQLRDDPAKSC